MNDFDPLVVIFFFAGCVVGMLLLKYVFHVL